MIVNTIIFKRVANSGNPSGHSEDGWHQYATYKQQLRQSALDSHHVIDSVEYRLLCDEQFNQCIVSGEFPC